MEPAPRQIFHALQSLLEQTLEIYVESGQAAGHPALIRLGVTDAAILNAMTEDRTLLTADLDLYLEAARLGHSAVNFTHYIEANG